MLPVYGRGEPLTAPVTAIVTAYCRIEPTLATLHKLHRCRPAPEQILVHVDGNQTACAEAIRRAYPDVIVMVSAENLGPGGARNKLIAEARHEFVASLDDDSYPVDDDYFARVLRLMAVFPEASILNACVFHRGEDIKDEEPRANWASDFSGGACVYRRSAFMTTSGYVPLPLAYGMEEVDLAIRLHSASRRILYTSFLRVFHDTDLSHHASPSITSASIANLALLTYLRYPPVFWPVGITQCLNRIAWLATHGRRAGIGRGLASIPRIVWLHRRSRKAVSAAAIGSYLKLRRCPVAVDLRPVLDAA